LLLDLDYSIVILDPASGQKTSLQSATGSNYLSSPGLCPDGKTMVLSGGALAQTIFRMDAGGGNLKRLTSGKRDLAPMCPDGKSVYYMDFGNTGFIRRISLDGGASEQITKFPDWGGGFDFSPDRKLIAFVGLVKPAPEYLLQLLVVDLNSGQTVQSFDADVTSGFNHIRFTRDGKAILFVKHAAAGDSLWLQPLNQSPATQLATFKSDVIWDMSYSPDAKKLAVIRAHTDSDVVLLRAQP
jgi:Tol biopolymer transport system component